MTADYYYYYYYYPVSGRSRAVDIPPSADALSKWLGPNRTPEPPRVCDHRGDWIHWAGPGSDTLPAHTGPCLNPAVFACRPADQPDGVWLYYCARHVRPGNGGWTIEPL